MRNDAGTSAPSTRLLRATSHVPSRAAAAYRFVVDRYCTVDLRTLALFRIAFGLFLLGDLYDRMRGLRGITFFTDDGVVPAHAMLEAHRAYQWSLFFAITTAPQLRAALCVIVVIYFAYLVGLWTRAMQVLVVIVWASLAQRNYMLENGGTWMVSTAAVFTAFLPLGERFSVDALRRGRRGPGHVSRLAYGFLIVDFAFIYLFNGAYKTRFSWRAGTAVHFALWQARVANSGAAWLRAHEPLWFSPVLSRVVPIVEVLIALLILSPLDQRRTRRAAIVLLLALHTSFSLLMMLGPFSYILGCLSLLLIGSDAWASFERWARPRWGALAARVAGRLEAAIGSRAPRREATPGGSALASSIAWLREGATAVVVAAALCSLSFENDVPRFVHLDRNPAWAASVVESLRMTQKWHMFAPDILHQTGTLVVDGELASHAHVDPRTGEPPDFEPMLHAPLDDGAIWRNYISRIAGNARFRPYLRDYFLRIHRLPGAPVHEPLVHVDVYWVSCTLPDDPAGAPTNLQRRILVSGDAPGLAPGRPLTP